MDSIQQEEVTALRDLAQTQEKSVEELKRENHELKNVIRAMFRKDKHIHVDCSIYGCSWICRMAKTLVKDL